MPRITISGVGRDVDGVFDLDLEDRFTGNELHLIKQHAGVRVGEIAEAMAASDYDLIVCLTKIALDRNGQDVTMERLMGAKVGALQFEPTDAEREEAEEEDALPPASAPSGAPRSDTDMSSSSPTSENGSDSIPESALTVIGNQGSPTGSGYSPETSVSSPRDS